MELNRNSVVACSGGDGLHKSILSDSLPENNWRDPASLAELAFSTSAIQQEATAVSPIRSESVAPIPDRTVVALHHPLGIAQKLQ